MIQSLLQLRRLRATECASASDLQALQAAPLVETIQHAIATVPYYRRLLHQAGVDPALIRTPEDLFRIPVTSKADLLAAGNDAWASDVDRATCTSKQTSGATQRPLRIPMTADEVRRHDLLVFRSLLSMGFRPRDRMAVVSAVGLHHTRLYQRLGLFRSCNISRLLPPGDQLLALQHFQPSFVWAYATVLRQLLPLLDDQLSRIIHPRAVIHTGEVLDPQLRTRLQDDLDAELFNLYGSTEIGIIAVECPAHRGLHVHADQLLLEAVGPGGPVATGEYGEAVVTCLWPRALPMIRYRVGDILRFLPEPCACGSALPLIGAPIGRNQDALVLSDGRQLYPGECDAFVGCRDVVQYRFLQQGRDRFVVQVKLRTSSSEAVMEQLRARAAAYLGNGAQVDLEVVERFNDPSIKFRSFIGDQALRRE